MSSPTAARQRGAVLINVFIFIFSLFAVLRFYGHAGRFGTSFGPALGPALGTALGPMFPRIFPLIINLIFLRQLNCGRKGSSRHSMVKFGDYTVKTGKLFGKERS